MNNYQKMGNNRHFFASNEGKMYILFSESADKNTTWPLTNCEIEHGGFDNSANVNLSEYITLKVKNGSGSVGFVQAYKQFLDSVRDDVKNVERVLTVHKSDEIENTIKIDLLLDGDVPTDPETGVVGRSHVDVVQKTFKR